MNGRVSLTRLAIAREKMTIGTTAVIAGRFLNT